MADAPSAHIDLTMRTTAFNARMSSVKRALEGLRQGLQRTGQAARRMLFVGGAAIVGLLALTARQVQEEAKLEAVLKATGNAAGFTADEMKKMAAAFQQVTTFGDEVVIGAQAILATFRNIKGAEFQDAMAAILDMSVVLGQDLKQGAIQLGKALNDPILGVTALTRVGITFTQKQKDMIKVFAETNQMARAQRVILDELANQFGGASTEAADTFIGRLKQLKNALGDLGETVGALFVPQVESLVKAVKDTLPPIAEWIKENKTTIVVVATLAAGLATLIAGLSVLGLAAAGVVAIIKSPIISGFVALAAAIVTAIGGFALLDAFENATARAAEKRLADLTATIKEARTEAKSIDPKKRVAAIEKEIAAVKTLRKIELDRAEIAKEKKEEAFEGLRDLGPEGETPTFGKRTELREQLIAQSREFAKASDKANEYRIELERLEKATKAAAAPLSRVAESTKKVDDSVEKFISRLKTERNLLNAVGIQARLLRTDLRDLTETERERVQVILDEIDAHGRLAEVEERRADARKAAAATSLSNEQTLLEIMTKIAVLQGTMTSREARLAELRREGLRGADLDRRIEKEETLARLQKEEAERKRRGTFTSAIEGATAVFRRIQIAAAGGATADPEGKARAALEAQKKGNTLTTEQTSILIAIKERLQNMKVTFS